MRVWRSKYINVDGIYECEVSPSMLLVLGTGLNIAENASACSGYERVSVYIGFLMVLYLSCVFAFTSLWISEAMVVGMVSLESSYYMCGDLSYWHQLL